MTSPDFRVWDNLQLIQPGHDFVYELLAHTRPALYLDVGAASGATVAKAKQYAPDARVIAFEPFPGNLDFFRRSTAALSGVTLVQKAVSNARGTQDFYVPHVVQAGEQANHWDAMAGYSSVGYLMADNASPEQDKVIRVQTCRLDDEVAERVGLLKIDVQGTEFGVLDGAHRLIDQFGVDMIFSEFFGDRRVLELLDAKGYDIFDTAYLVFTPDNPVGPLLKSPQTFPLSTGAQGYSGYLGQPINRDAAGYCDFFRHGGCQTDLFAVRKDLTPDILDIVATLARR